MEKSNCVTGAERVPITPEICLKAFEKASNEEDRDGMERAIAMWMSNEDVVSTGVGSGGTKLKLSDKARELYNQGKYSEAMDVHYEDLVRNATGSKSIDVEINGVVRET